MKLLDKKILQKAISIFSVVVIIAGITYFSLNYFILSTNKNYQSKNKTEIETEQDKNKRLTDLIKQETDKIEKRINSKQNLEVNQRNQLLLKKINQYSISNTTKKKQSSNAKVNSDKETNNNIVVEIKTDTIQPEVNVNNQDDFKNKEMKKRLYLGIKDGYVAIYKGEVLEDNTLIEVKKNIPIESLPQQDVKNLQLGIEVDSREEMLGILEGFASAKDE